MKPTRKSRKAFTLIEVTLALGVASFCLITVFGLIPIGLTTNQNASEQTAAAGIASAISADLHSNPVVTGSTSRFQMMIPPAGSGTTETLYFSQDGAATEPAGATTAVNASAVASGAGGISRYRATITLQPQDANVPSSAPATPYNKIFKATILITWPALADPNPVNAPVNFAGSFATATTVDCN
jgi:uncharacterized protein (TIGR02598 family)